MPAYTPEFTAEFSIEHLALTNYRSYERLDFSIGGQSVYLYGANGAGKTNILEAISMLSPGRGLRGAPLSELGRRNPGETTPRPWGAAVKLRQNGETVRLGTGSDGRDPNKRSVRIDGETQSPSRLLDYLLLVWLTPAQDRLFVEARSERLRFFDRLVYAGKPSHAGVINAYDKALRERIRLLTQGPMDLDWLGVLESRLAECGLLMIQARKQAIQALQSEIDAHQSAFPKALLAIVDETQSSSSTFEALSPESLSPESLSPESLRDGFKRSRSRDAGAARTLYGPHRANFSVNHKDKLRPAAEGSTGEQKALLLTLILAQGARLAKLSDAIKPTLLLDEVAAHLDPIKRHALFDETHHLGLQTFFTGTDLSLFEGLRTRALGARVESGQLIDFI
jgi:DNA replication and repair protein RecF